MNQDFQLWEENLSFKPYKEILGQKRKDIKEPELFLDENTKERFFNFLPYAHVDNYNLTVNTNCTSLIEEVFRKEVDDETLVIYSNKEHPKVQELIEKQKHILQIDFNDINKLNIIDLKEAKNYKKVFLYIIGTQVSSGEITPQMFFTKAKQYFTGSQIKHKILLDDCHGMFFVPRDYSIFDYITGTAHAYIEDYDMGILLSKESFLGYNSSIWVNDYLDRIELLYGNLLDIQDMKQLLTNYFSKYLGIYGCKPIITSPTIFAIKFEGLYFPEKLVNTLKPYNISIEGINQFESYIRIRIPYLLKDCSKLEKGLKVLDGIIDFVKKI